MAATNPAVAAQFTVGVHRNSAVTKSHKTMVSIPSTPTKFPLLRGNSVHGRSDARIMAANPEAIVSSPNLMGVQVFTECRFQNHSGQNLTLEDCMYWHGYGDTPETISSTTVEFKHFGDTIGSIGAVSYLIGDNVRWIIAWSNSEEDQLKLNKVYSEISEVTERGVDWGLIREALDQNVSEYITMYNEHLADLVIDQTNTTPTMTATLNVMG